MKFIKSNELNKKKWDDLVFEKNGAFYSKSDFLDIMSKNWGVYVNEAYTKGVAVCYNKVLNLKRIYPPIFSKTTNFIGLNDTEYFNLISQIKKDFNQGSIYLNEDFSNFDGVINQVYQELKEDKIKLNQQAKRMLTKAVKSEIQIKQTSANSSVDLILSILSTKIKDIDNQTFKKIKTLIQYLETKKEIIAFGIYDLNSNLHGGLIFHKEKTTVTYLTGACDEQTRDKGGMYLAMKNAIEYSITHKKVINFGGSNIENIRRFYTSFGGEDVTYYKYEWDNSPVWFGLFQKVKYLLKK